MDGEDRHTTPTYALVELPRPGNRETRLRETGAAWLARQAHEEEKP